MRTHLTAVVARAGHAGAVSNAREAATELSRRRVERDEVELYLARVAAVTAPVAHAEGGRPQEAVHG